MPTKIIRLKDGTLVEAEASPDERQQISGGAAQRVDSALDSIEPLLLRACSPLKGAWDKLKDVGLNVDSIELELGLSFEGEGNLFVTKAKAGANFTVKVSMRRPQA
jgi:hypothetical protein